MNITIAGMGYVGLSLAVLLSQENQVTIIDILTEKVDLLNRGISPINDDLIQRYLDEGKENKRVLCLQAKTSMESYVNTDLVIVAAPTNYDPRTNFFDTSKVEEIIGLVPNDKPVIIKSTVPVGYTEQMRRKTGKKIIFSPSFFGNQKLFMIICIHPG